MANTMIFSVCLNTVDSPRTRTICSWVIMLIVESRFIFFIFSFYLSLSLSSLSPTLSGTQSVSLTLPPLPNPLPDITYS